MKKTIAVITSVVLLLCLFAGSAFAGESITSKQVKKEAQATAAFVTEELLKPENATLLYQYGETVTAAAQTGIDSTELKTAYAAAFQARLDDNGGQLPADADNSGYYAWGINALEALGVNAADFEGYNLFELFEATAAVNPNLYNNCTALDMILKHKDKFDDSAALEELFLQAIKETFKENVDETGAPADGKNAGWFYWGISVDNNGTVISAAAPYYDTDNAVKEQIDKALAYCATEKQALGYMNYGSANANSTGKMVSAFSALNDTENAVAAYNLLQLYRSAETGAYTYYDEDDLYATRDALAALNALAVMLEKQEPEEGTTTPPEETTVPAETTAQDTTVKTQTETTTTAGNNAGKTTPSTGDSAILLYIPAALLGLSAAGIVLLKKRKAAEY